MKMSPYQEFIHRTRYARFREDLGRREHWDETVNRYLDFFEGRFPKVVKPIRHELFDAIHELDVMPSMRALWTAGPALDRDEAAAYNCAAIALDSLNSFDTALYLLLCGTGVGFDASHDAVKHLPRVADEFFETDTTIVVADSKVGWCKATKETIALAFSGQLVKHDLSRIRPAGTRLKTFGGRASGPEPLAKMLKNVVGIIKGAAGRQLKSIEAHDIMCEIAACVVVGGTRRSAMISLSDAGDHDMATAKSGNWWELNPGRALANNSIVYDGKPSIGEFMREWCHIYESKSGERGIVNRAAMRDLSPSRRNADEWNYSPNPCAEIRLRTSRRDGAPGHGGQLCNLTEVIVRPSDRLPQLKAKVRIGVILGSLQSTLTNFRYLPASFKRNCEEERLLGVSLSGIYDNEWLVNCSPSVLEELRDYSVEVNIEYAKKLKINPSAAVTTVKPSGTVSALVDSAAGIHPRFHSHYWRRVRNDKKDPASQALIDAGIPYVQDPYNHEAWVFKFPMSTAKGAITMDDVSAVDQLNIWKKFNLSWTEHQPSVTITVAENEWMEVGAWCYENFHILGGVSFLPKEDENHTYMEAPYERATPGEIKGYPKVKPIDWDSVAETFDKETEFACSAGACDI